MMLKKGIVCELRSLWKKFFHSGSHLFKLNLFASAYIFHRLFSGIFILFLSRIYSPASFGDFAAYSMVVLVFAPLVTLGLENAILFEGNAFIREKVVRFLVISGCFIAFMGSVLLGFVFYSIDMEVLYFFIPLHLGFFIASEALIHFSLKEEKFKQIFIYQLAMVFVTFITQFALGILYGDNPVFIVVGFTIGYALSLIYLYSYGFLSFHNFKDMKSSTLKVLSHNKSYIAFNTPSNILDALLQFVPVFYIKSMYSVEAAGVYFLSMKLLSLPITCIAGPTAKYFLKTVSSDTLDHEGLRKNLIFFLCLMGGLSGLIYVSLFVIETSGILSFLLGSAWSNVHDIYSILTLKYMVQFFVFPFIYLYISAGKLAHLVTFKSLFLILLWGLTITVGTKSLPVLLNATIYAQMGFYAFLFLWLYLFIIRKSTGIRAYAG